MRASPGQSPLELSLIAACLRSRTVQQPETEVGERFRVQRLPVHRRQSHGTTWPPRFRVICWQLVLHTLSHTTHSERRVACSPLLAPKVYTHTILSTSVENSEKHPERFVPSIFRVPSTSIGHLLSDYPRGQYVPVSLAVGFPTSRGIRLSGADPRVALFKRDVGALEPGNTITRWHNLNGSLCTSKCVYARVEQQMLRLLSSGRKDIAQTQSESVETGVHLPPEGGRVNILIRLMRRRHETLAC